MSRIEKRLWIIWFSIFLLALGSSFGFSAIHKDAFPNAAVTRLRHALRPDREARKLERAASVEGIETIRIQTTSTHIRVTRNEAMNDLAVTLEGRFSKSALSPLDLEKQSSVLQIRVDDGLNRMDWLSAFDEESRNSELSIVLPRQFSGHLMIETVNGNTSLEGLSLGELNWSSVSGELQSQRGEIHVARLKSISGDLDFDGASLEFYLNLTSADAHVKLLGLEHAVSPKIDAQTVSGKIELAVSAQASVRISISSFTGVASSSLALKKSMQSSGALEGQIGEGRGELRLRSVSGSVRLTTI